MYKFLRMASLAATVAALGTSPVFAAASSATATPQAKAQVRILKPLTLSECRQTLPVSRIIYTCNDPLMSCFKLSGQL